MTTEESIIKACCYLLFAIAMQGSMLQMSLGQPKTTPRLDNIHRFLAGLYFGTGLICFYNAYNIDKLDGVLTYLIAIGVWAAGCGRLLSMQKV